MNRSQMVREFMSKFEIPLDQDVKLPYKNEREHLIGIGRFLAQASQQILSSAKQHNSVALTRLGLILEEVGELAEGLLLGRPSDVADAITDIAFLVEGTAATYGIHLDPCFDEVYRSNMTKQICEDTAKPMKTFGFYTPQLAQHCRFEGRIAAVATGVIKTWEEVAKTATHVWISTESLWWTHDDDNIIEGRNLLGETCSRVSVPEFNQQLKEAKANRPGNEDTVYYFVYSHNLNLRGLDGKPVSTNHWDIVREVVLMANPDLNLLTTAELEHVTAGS